MMSDRKDRLIVLVLFLIVSSLYFWTAAGITSTNEGSHYALIRAMGDEGRFEISTYIDYTGYNDYSAYEGRFYSDRPPGTALLALPFYFFSRILPTPPAPASVSIVDDNPAVVTLLMLPAIAGGLVAAMLYLLLRDAEIGRPAPVIAALAYAFGSLIFKYGGVLYSHAVSSLCVLAGIFFTLKAVRRGGVTPGLGLILGFSLGYSVLAEYNNAIFMVLALFYLAIRLKNRLFTGKCAKLSLLAMFVGGMLPIGFLLFYNATNFGSPFSTSYTYVQTYEWARSFATTFDFPLWDGLKGQLWSGWDTSKQELQVQGIFLLMPVTLLAIPGLWEYGKKRGKEALLTLGIFLVYLVLMAKHRTFGGYTGDTRYLTSFLALLFLPVGFVLERVFTMKECLQKTALTFIAFSLIFLSVRNMLLHIGYSFNYHLDLCLVHRQAGLPEDWLYMAGNIFVNGWNLPMLWLLEGIIGALIAGGIWLRNRRAPQSPAV